MKCLQYQLRKKYLIWIDSPQQNQAEIRSLKQHFSLINIANPQQALLFLSSLGLTNAWDIIIPGRLAQVYISKLRQNRIPRNLFIYCYMLQKYRFLNQKLNWQVKYIHSNPKQLISSVLSVANCVSPFNKFIPLDDFSFRPLQSLLKKRKNQEQRNKAIKAIQSLISNFKNLKSFSSIYPKEFQPVQVIRSFKQNILNTFFSYFVKQNCFNQSFAIDIIASDLFTAVKTLAPSRRSLTKSVLYRGSVLNLKDIDLIKASFLTPLLCLPLQSASQIQQISNFQLVSKINRVIKESRLTKFVIYIVKEQQQGLHPMRSGYIPVWNQSDNKQSRQVLFNWLTYFRPFRSSIAKTQQNVQYQCVQLIYGIEDVIADAVINKRHSYFHDLEKGCQECQSRDCFISAKRKIRICMSCLEYKKWLLQTQSLFYLTHGKTEVCGSPLDYNLDCIKKFKKISKLVDKSLCVKCDFYIRCSNCPKQILCGCNYDQHRTHSKQTVLQMDKGLPKFVCRQIEQEQMLYK